LEMKRSFKGRIVLASVILASTLLIIVVHHFYLEKPKQITFLVIENKQKPNFTESTAIQTVSIEASSNSINLLGKNDSSLNYEEGNKPKPEINMPRLDPMSWSNFHSTHSDIFWSKNSLQPSLLDEALMKFEGSQCSESIVSSLKRPQLSVKDFSWCQWALSESGAGVVVGKSWGKLNKVEMLKFDALNCNTVKSGKNPSCDDSWGDIAIRKWRTTPLENIGCDVTKTSKVHCNKNDNMDTFCTMENVQIDFSKWKTVKRPGNTDSKSFSQDFLSSDCSYKSKEPLFPFPHLYSPKLSSTRCDYIHNGTLLLYSHDDIRNLGHTLNDIMNIWVMLWLGQVARYSHNLNILNIDSFKLGHNWLDEPNAFFNIYRKNFNEILKGVDFQDKTLCVQKLIIQPIPPRFFIWESWFIDLPCSFLGPSSLYQRYNLHVRHSYGLLATPKNGFVSSTEKVLRVLLVVRKIHKNLWGSNRSSRNYLNLPALVSSLNETMKILNSNLQVGEGGLHKHELVVIDFNDYSFDEQVKLIGETSIMIGMHGAGMAGSMHMPIGTRFCCGMIEIYPHGEFTPIRGHGNMARKMGIKYERIDIPSAQSESQGAHVPVTEVSSKLVEMISKMRITPTCIIPDVITDPFLEKP